MDKYIIPNLRNACRVLKLLADEKSGLPLPAITRALTLPRTTALRIMTTLHAEDMIDQIGKRYVLGTGLIHLGIRTLENVDLRAIAIPVLHRLSQATEETSHLAVLSSRKSLILEVCDSPNPVRVASRPGTLADIHCSATGKVFIANRIEDLDEFFQNTELSARTPNTLTTLAALRAAAVEIRRQGFAVDDEEYSVGVRCLAAPIRDAFGRVAAAIGITASTSTFPKRRVKTVSQEVIAAAAEISAALGQHPRTPAAEI